MSDQFYRLLHLTGVFMLFLGLGGMFASEAGKGSKLYAVLHGLGFLLVLVCGFGLKERMAIPFGTSWLIAKIAILVLLGGLPVLAKRGVLPRPAAAMLAIGLGVAAFWLVRYKPF